jgi:hypothetical protein
MLPAKALNTLRIDVQRHCRMLTAIELFGKVISE